MIEGTNKALKRLGIDHHSIEQALALLDHVFVNQPVARAGMECALLDALAQHAGQPLCTWLTGTPPCEVTTDMTLPIADPAHMAELARGHWEAGFGIFKVKIGKAIDDASEQGAELARQGNAAAKRQAGVDPQVGLDGIAYLGSFRKEAWALFFTTRAVVTLGAEQVPATSAAALAVIDHQVTYLYAYTYESDASGHGRSWAERAVSDWANSVRWASSTSRYENRPCAKPSRDIASASSAFGTISFCRPSMTCTAHAISW